MAPNKRDMTAWQNLTCERDQIMAWNLYIGVLPIPMVKEILDAGSRFFLLVLPDLAFGQRGAEMTPEQMDRGRCPPAGGKKDRDGAG